MSNRFFVEPPIAEAATLVGGEAHHLLHVMRANVGDSITLFDGSGAEFSATITVTRRSEVDCEITERREVDRELPFAVTLGVAMPKGDRQKQLVEKLTELGVTRLAPLMTERSVAELKPSALDKLRRTVIEASKQCRRNRLMEIAEPCSLAAFMDTMASCPRRIVLHPSGDPLRREEAETDAAALVGPEGGFSDEEVEAAVGCGWLPLSLGPRILRIETAALGVAVALGTDR